MIKPIFLYPSECLYKKSKEIYDKNTIYTVVSDLFDTMRNAEGIGLAAPQIGLNLRIFVIDPTPLASNKNENETLKKFVMAFINPIIIKTFGRKWTFEEGCLSIPFVRIPVERHFSVKIRFMDKNLKIQTCEFHGMVARIIQHEYDHLEGSLIVDPILNGLSNLNPSQKEHILKTLEDIKNHKITPPYPSIIK